MTVPAEPTRNTDRVGESSGQGRDRRRLWLGGALAVAGVLCVGVAVAVVGDSQICSNASTGYEQRVLTAKPIGYWRLGEKGGTDAVDSSGNDSSGSYGRRVGRGVAGALDCDTDTAASFDGVDARVTLPDRGFDFQGDQPFTLQAWITSTTITPGPFSRIVSKEMTAVGRRKGSSRDGYSFWLDPSVGLGFERYAGKVIDGVSFSEGVPVGKYRLVTATFDTRRMRLYINDAMVASVDLENPVELDDVDTPLMVGRQSDRPGSFFEGVIDEVAVFDRALTVAEIEELYAASR